jgi:fatty acid desaturase
MKFAAYLVGMLSVPIYYIVLAYLLTGLALALHKLSEVFGGVLMIWLILPAAVTLSLWCGHQTTRFLLRRWSREADASEGRG